MGLVIWSLTKQMDTLRPNDVAKFKRLNTKSYIYTFSDIKICIKFDARQSDMRGDMVERLHQISWQSIQKLRR